MQQRTKNALITAAIVIAFLVMGFAGNSQTTTPTNSTAKDTTINGKRVTMYIGSHGGRYLLVVSRTGNTYKKYLPKH